MGIPEIVYIKNVIFGLRAVAAPRTSRERAESMPILSGTRIHGSSDEGDYRSLTIEGGGVYFLWGVGVEVFSTNFHFFDRVFSCCEIFV